MDVILHIGAHRCATTTFQRYMRLNCKTLERRGIGFWGPRRTRNGLFSGLIPGSYVARTRNLPRRAAGRIQLNCARSAAQGIKKLVVSDENMMGTMRENLRVSELYCGVGERLSRYSHGFGGQITDVVLNIRSLELYWASTLGFCLSRGCGMPRRHLLERLAYGPRSWRDVVVDVACAVSGARIWVLPFETFAGQPEVQLAAVTGINPPKTYAREWLNQTPCLSELREFSPELPDGDQRWQPFDAVQIAALREQYNDDLMWLTGGADGLAQLLAHPDKKPAGTYPLWEKLTRGQDYDKQERRLEGTG